MTKNGLDHDAGDDPIGKQNGGVALALISSVDGASCLPRGLQLHRREEMPARPADLDSGPHARPGTSATATTSEKSSVKDLTDLAAPRHLAWDFGKIPLFPPDADAPISGFIPVAGDHPAEARCRSGQRSA